MSTFQGAIADHNLKVYETKAVAGEYLGQDRLFPAEQAFFDQITHFLPNMRMLDIGIGGGRTTFHFSPKVREYLGIDYAASMIEACHTRFPNPAPNVSFAVGDVRDLSAYADGAFDLVLFSYNGLDYIPHEDRLQALAGMNRVTKPGGHLVFSSHNLMSLGIPSPTADQSWFRRTGIQALMFAINGRLASLRKNKYAIVRDDGCGFRLKTYYVRPSEQLRRLADLGLQEVSILGLDGKTFTKPDSVDDIRDAWLYYLAKKPIS